MIQGDELRAGLENVYSMIRQYEDNFTERESLRSQLRQLVNEKVELSFQGGKGKAKMTGIAVFVYIMIYLLLGTIIYGRIGTWLAVAVGGAVTFVCVGVHPVIAFLAGAVVVVILLSMIYECAIMPTIRAFATGNIAWIVLTLVMVAVLVLIIYIINHKAVRASNSKIRKANEEIMANNAVTVDRIKELNTDAAELVASIKRQLTPMGFYPQQYLYEHAAAYFVQYVRNLQYGTPITMAYLIEQYKTDEHRQAELQHWKNEEIHWQRVEDLIQHYGEEALQNQQFMINQLRFQNIISIDNNIRMREQNNILSSINGKLHY